MTGGCRYIIIVISLVSYIYDLCKMVFDCLLVVVDVFEVVVGGC